MDRVLEADDSGALTIPSDMLAEPAAHARYIVERVGETLNVRPVDLAQPPGAGHDERMRLWKELGRRVAEASQTAQPSVDILSEMRR